MSEERKKDVPTVKHNIGVTVWLDWETVKELNKIALFEREKRAPLCRRIIVEKIQVYRRNPAYKRFLKQLARSEEK